MWHYQQGPQWIVTNLNMKWPKLRALALPLGESEQSNYSDDQISLPGRLFHFFMGLVFRLLPSCRRGEIRVNYSNNDNMGGCLTKDECSNRQPFYQLWPNYIIKSIDNIKRRS